jgi:AraC-like DNA-binding protein
MALLDIARLEVDEDHHVAKASIVRASALLRVEIDRETPNDNLGTRAGLLAWQAYRVLEYIDERIAARILIADLSGIVHRSQADFTRAFRQTFGQTPGAYVVRRRVELASHLMRISEDSLSNIALRCGFTDQAHLCRLFRRSVGQSPVAWRKQIRTDARNHQTPRENYC